MSLTSLKHSGGWDLLLTTNVFADLSFYYLNIIFLIHVCLHRELAHKLWKATHVFQDLVDFQCQGSVVVQQSKIRQGSVSL